MLDGRLFAVGDEHLTVAGLVVEPARRVFDHGVETILQADDLVIDAKRIVPRSRAGWVQRGLQFLIDIFAAKRRLGIDGHDDLAVPDRVNQPFAADCLDGRDDLGDGRVRRTGRQHYQIESLIGLQSWTHRERLALPYPVTRRYDLAGVAADLGEFTRRHTGGYQII